jgi:cardiolipin hydrolase
MFNFFKSPPKLTNKAFFSPGNDCLNAIISAIDLAKANLKICVFTISDDRITQALLQAHRRGVKIRILTDNEKLFDLGSDIKQLAQAGIEVRTDTTRNHMHHKFALIDNHTLLTGSYNWTRSAALYNHENVVFTNSKDLVLDFLGEFDRLWQEMPVFR